MLIDTHCHLSDERLARQIDGVLSRARSAGVMKIIAPSTSLSDAKMVVEMADKHDGLFGLVGVHPENMAHLSLDIAHLKDELRILISSSKKIVGIGEIGLDFHYDVERKSKDRQIAIFQGQLELAVELGLPVAIHMRDAEDEINEMLQRQKRLPRGQFHCWSGSDKLLKLVLEKGFYVSFCGNITYKSAQNLRTLIKMVPLDRLLLETDSPYLSPEGRPADSSAVRAGGRGSLNEPVNVTILAEYIANLLDLPTETLINQTTKNAECLYFPG